MALSRSLLVIYSHNEYTLYIIPGIPNEYTLHIIK